MRRQCLICREKITTYKKVEISIKTMGKSTKNKPLLYNTLLRPVCYECAQSMQFGKKILKELEESNPYPKYLFTPMKIGEIRRYVKLLQDNGFSSDRIHAHWGRQVWKNCCDELKKIME
jgi:hypothetical protein